MVGRLGRAVLVSALVSLSFVAACGVPAEVGASSPPVADPGATAAPGPGVPLAQVPDDQAAEQGDFVTSGVTTSRPGVRPYALTPETVTALDDAAYPVDVDGVLQVAWEGYDEPVYHPVSMTWYALKMLESYRVTGTQEYLHRAESNARALLDGADRGADGEYWFGYPFPYDVHQDPAMGLGTPWYSGMAQGMVLSLVSRLYGVTGDPAWRDAADAILATYDARPRQVATAPGDAPWFAYVDADGNLWLEEYPGTAQASHVVNGHIYSSWGLADYLDEIDPADERAARSFDGAVTTIRDHFDEYRVPGGISYYCVAQYCHDTAWQPENYHRGVVAQLRMLRDLTGDPAIAAQAEVLVGDYWR